MKPVRSVVVSFFPDTDGGRRTLRELRQHGLRHAAAMWCSQGGHVSIAGNEFSRSRTAIISASVALAILAAYASTPFAPSGGEVTQWIVGAILVSLASAAGGLMFRWLAGGVEPRLLASYRHWVMPGESMVLVHVSSDQVGAALDLLQNADGGQAASFLIRPPSDGQAPTSPVLRRERFSAEQIKRHAAELANKHKVDGRAGRAHPLWDQVRTINRTIDAISFDLAEVAQREQGLSQAAEWLLDNGYIIQRHIGDVQRNLSRRLYDALPVLEGPANAGEPRVYALALEFIALTDDEVYEQDLVDFLLSYQETSPLAIAELWAMPLMLRIALIGNLCNRAREIERRQHEHERADLWANRLLSAARRDPDHLLFALAQLAREQPEPSAYVVDRLVSQLLGEPLALDSIRAWLEHKLGEPISEVVQYERREHAADHVTLANAITSLRQLSQLDWRDIFERVSPVDRVLRSDPAGVYILMDFATQDRYRHAIEDIARGSNESEVAVAERAVETARLADVHELNAHVGYFLIDAGRAELEAQTHYRPPVRRRLRQWIRRHPEFVFLGGIGTLTIGILAFVLALAGIWSASGTRLVAFMVMVALACLPASELAVQFVNALLTRLLPPAVLPKLSFDDGIPDEWRTLVVVPELLLTPDSIQEDLAQLEIRFLANHDPNLHFALLADFPDAPNRDMPDDEALLAAAVHGTEQLNARYPGNHFSFLYRRRRWSESEQTWMGWERKRGKLEELNRLLAGDSDSVAPIHPVQRGGMLQHVGDPDQLRGIRFVITLDADTQLTRGTARRMAATLAHPLNRPRLAADGMTVDAGYTIIQPRVTTSLPSATATRFSRIFTNPIGADPYLQAVSDLYQDLTGEGSYHGKGIYDVQMFHRVLNRRLPDAAVLSHDLLEGAHVRVGLASDIELFDFFPETYLAYSNRQHRWIRGDWQIAEWGTSRVPNANGAVVSNPLSLLNRWKILDNLRRSMLPAAIVAMLVIGWVLLPEAAVIWSGFVALVLLLPPALQLMNWLTAQPSITIAGWREIAPSWKRAGISVALLPHQAVIGIDAMVRVAYRRMISHRLLLEWQPSEITHRTAAERGRGLVRRMGVISLFAAAVLIAIARSQPGAVWSAVPFLALWAASPAIVHWLDSYRDRLQAAVLADADQLLLRMLARQTWRYFDDFVGPESNWLPPDNYQEALRVEVAQRTSPTNIGLWMLSSLAASDHGYLTLDDLVDRNLKTLETLQKLERFEGHLLNWYDTQTLAPLAPRYVSTVDSGNLLASLWASTQGFQEMLNLPIIGPQALVGMADTLALLREAMENEPEAGMEAERSRQLLSRLEALCDDPPDHFIAVIHRLRAAAGSARELTEALQRLQHNPTGLTRQSNRSMRSVASERPMGSPAVYWSTQLDRQVGCWLAIIDRYLPWVEYLARPTDDSLLAGSADALDWQQQGLAVAPSARDLAAAECATFAQFRSMYARNHVVTHSSRDWQDDFEVAAACARQNANELLARTHRLTVACNNLADGMQMRFLYDSQRRLFTIGFNVDALRLDTSYYDLLASEARLASFVSVARNDVPVAHWLTLGRIFGLVSRRQVLLSWSGTMFEYLMPLLIMRSFPNSLLDEACRAAVMSQIDYASRRGIPWGISESAFSAVDAQRIYQYKAFGVPGLGVKRGLEDDVVVAPYATALALLVEPRAALSNLRRLDRLGLRGNYGYYDSIDYTRQWQPDGKPGLIAYTYMAHHQGMILVAIANTLHDNVMQSRFRADRRVEATEPVLFERIPVSPLLVEGAMRDGAPPQLTATVLTTSPNRVTAVDAPTPRTQLLGNGTYSVMVSSAGGGYSRWRDIDLSRWRADTTLDAWGSFCYVKDLAQGTTWSTAHQPVQRAASSHSVTFSADRAEFERRDSGIGTFTELAVSLEDDAELRRITLVNYSSRPRQLEVTSYMELALAPHRADLAHPALSKLFIQTDALLERNALLAWRKPRSRGDQPVWAGHVVALPSPADMLMRAVQYETDRARFLGRGRGTGNPAALEGELSNTTGAVLDPIFSLRCQVSIGPGQRLQLVFVTGAAETREGVLALVEKYSDERATSRAFDLARSRAQLEPRQLRVSAEDIQRFQQLASHMLFPNARLRVAEHILRQNHLGQSRLWAYGISGDLPILLVTIGDSRDLELVREVLAAHSFWRLRGFTTDLVILNEEAGGYEQPLRESLLKLIQVHAQNTPLDQRGGIFLRSIDHIPSDELTLLLSTARVALVAARGSLAQQLTTPVETPKYAPALAMTRILEEEPSAPLPFLQLPYFNGLGGFTPDGKEYAIYLGPGSQTPAPWVNVFANPDFGSLVSESGSGFSWHGNSQSNRLLPWSNDPISDPPGDAVFIRDEDTGVFWTPTAAPIRENEAYRARHGQGYTVFEHNSHAIEQELVTFVPMDGFGGVPVRVQRVRLRNSSSRFRRLSVFAFAEWVLGENHEDTQMHVVTRWDVESQALFARNAYHPDVGSRIAFASANPNATSYTGDRTEFLGRNGSRSNPAALRRRALSGRSGAGLDPCVALQVIVELEPGQTSDVIFLLGQAADPEAARNVLRRFQTAEQVDTALNETRAWWDQLLETIQVETPDLAINFMLNRWLLYQTLSCRVWGRSGFYQSGGAIGFRDQLQDAMALVYTAPEISRRQILTSAARQFTEGDVQHWWHPQSGAGVRTRISDDLLWLPYVITHYVRVTGDAQILAEIVPYLEGPLLEEHEHERYFVPTIAMEDGSLVEHCHRAIVKGLTTGSHGLPLIGTGDWNDGLNLVGAGGRGESVWLAWFLIDVLQSFANLLEQSGQHERTDWYRTEAQRLAVAVEEQAWDGEWYRRAYFDNGTPLGSKDNQEARIDSIAQSWGVISGAADHERAGRALESVESYLVREHERLILLFTPPIEHSPLDPGYVKGYPPGVRENGGQYTHAAIWVAMAFARRGNGDRATELLQMLNPVEHTRTPEDVARYKVEPYVVAADVYALEGHVGRGGWTWYTGSSGWMYRTWIEDVLGFKLRGDQLTIDPVLQHDWHGIRIRFRYHSAHYEITIENPDSVGRGVLWIEVDHTRVSGKTIELRDDGATHPVVVRLGHPAHHQIH